MTPPNANGAEQEITFGGQTWGLRATNRPHPNEAFDVAVALDWANKPFVIHTQSRLMQALAPSMRLDEFVALSNEEKALFLEHVLSNDLERLEQAAAEKISIAQVRVAHPRSVAEFPMSGDPPIAVLELRNNTTFATLLTESGDPAAMLHLQELLGRLFQTSGADPSHFAPAHAQGGGMTPPNGNRMRVAMGPALIELQEALDLEQGDVIELNLPASTEMDAVFIDEAGGIIPILLQNGRAVLGPQSTPMGHISESGVFFEFAHSMPAENDGASIPIIPMENGEVLVLIQGRLHCRGRFVNDQGRLCVSIEQVEPAA